MKTESSLMSFFRKLNMDPIAWSLRRIYCPVKKSDLVLELGSGSNPFFRSNVLCDAFAEDTPHRHFEKLIHDRPTVLAFAEDLPFKDDSFDFVIACHVLEHSEDPAKFLSEIQRVAKAGYIEVPDAFVERLTTYSVHRLEITDRDNGLVIRKKKGIIEDVEVSELFRHKAWEVFNGFFSKKPFHFHVRYYWNKDNGGIKYHIVNPEYKFDWDLRPLEGVVLKPSLKQNIKKIILLAIRKFLSQNRRNEKINLPSLMKCKACGYEKLLKEEDGLICGNCRNKYKINGHIVNTIL
ncbi:MAG: class I SAM-dependent methyltransferase [Candidatus Falkowbacteria bacterium]